MEVSKVKYKPILFSTQMVEAILEGKKTQTRRIIKDDILQNNDVCIDLDFILTTGSYKITVGDILWVRETFSGIVQKDESIKYHYKAENWTMSEALKPFWKPSIHMPKKACRLFLKVKSIKIEKLQDISEADAISEGCSEYGPFGEYRGSIHPSGGKMKYRAYSKASNAFKCIWESINGEKSWLLNPWVWVIEFERIDKPEDFLKQ